MDQRRDNRKDTFYYTPVREAGTGRIVGRLVDVSEHGIAIMRETALPSEAVLNLEMELPYEMHGHDTLRFRAEVRWSGPFVNPEYVRVGLHIVECDNDLHSILQTLMHEACFERA